MYAGYVILRHVRGWFGHWMALGKWSLGLGDQMKAMGWDWMNNSY
jgi:hypothetical protein